jgi:hypothetical protein
VQDGYYRQPIPGEELRQRALIDPVAGQPARCAEVLADDTAVQDGVFVVKRPNPAQNWASASHGDPRVPADSRAVSTSCRFII